MKTITRSHIAAATGIAAVTLSLTACAPRVQGNSGTPVSASTAAAQPSPGSVDADLSSVDQDMNQVDNSLNQADNGINSTEGDPTR